MCKKILDAIVDYMRKHSYPPTVQEITDMIGFKSKNTTRYYLQKMLKAGLIETDHPGCPRAIKVPGYMYVKRKEN